MASKKRLPDNITYVSREQGFAAGFGGIGAAIVAAAETDRRESIETAMNRLDLGGIMATQLNAQLERRRLLPINHNPAEANATLYIEPKVAGLILKNSFSSRLCPVIAGEISLIRRDGSVIYRRTVRDWERTEDDLAYTREEYVNNPQLLQRVFQDISRKWALKVVETLEPK